MSWDVAPSQDFVSQGWGCTSYAKEWPAPWCAGGYYHAGIDLGYSGGGNATCGRPVYATRGGVVVAVGANGQGNSYYSQYLGPYAVCVRYDDGIYVLHGHLSAASVSVGQRVAAGQWIGAIGTLGASSACHLHVEARADGAYQGVINQAANVRDPRPYLNKLALPVEVNVKMYVIGTDPQPGGFGIYSWNGTGWSRMPGGAVQVLGVDSSGAPWVKNDQHQIFRWDGSAWRQMPGAAE